VKKLVVLAALLLLLTGCLPPGEPPPGDIVSNHTQVRTPAEISEHLATKLSLFMLEKHPQCAWKITADPDSLQLARAAVRECVSFGCPLAETAQLELRGEHLADGWRYTFFDHGNAVWSEKYMESEK